MAFNFVLPDLGEGIAEAEIRKWLIKEGDAVEEHQAIVELETDKAVVEVPSPKKGTVLKRTGEEGQTIKVGDVLIVLGEAGEKISGPTQADERPAATERPKSVSVVGELPEEEEEVRPRPVERPSAVAPVPSVGKGEVLAMPAVRALAKEKGLDLSTVPGSGPGGSVTQDDVRKALRQPATAGDSFGPVERVAIKGVRKKIAQNLLFALRTTAPVTETDEADITGLWDLREREKNLLKEKGVHLTFMPFIMKAVQHTLMEFATFNASVDEEREEIMVKHYYSIGVAVDTPEGLIVPVVRNIEKRTIRDLASELQDLSKRARERTLKLDELKGSTFTITNYGAYGAQFATPIINYPDVAILGTGRIIDKPLARGGQVAIRKVLPLSLTFDHRVNDGAGAAKFLTRLVKYLEDPDSIFIESA